MRAGASAHCLSTTRGGASAVSACSDGRRESAAEPPHSSSPAPPSSPAPSTWPSRPRSSGFHSTSASDAL
eukprot:2980755-Rhodomonas_salina.1